MKRTRNSLSHVSATRRDFLKATSALAAAAALSPLDWGCPAGGSEPAAAIRIRGHHLFDMLEALGTGKSAHKTLGPVALKIRANPKTPIQVVIGVDDICAPCEWWDHAKGICTRTLTTHPEDNEAAMTSDKNAIRMLGLKPGDVRNADDLYRLIRTKVTKRVFAEEVCVACRLVNRCKETYEPRIEAVLQALSEPHS